MSGFYARLVSTEATSAVFHRAAPDAPEISDRVIVERVLVQVQRVPAPAAPGIVRCRGFVNSRNATRLDTAKYPNAQSSYTNCGGNATGGHKYVDEAERTHQPTEQHERDHIRDAGHPE